MNLRFALLMAGLTGVLAAGCASSSPRVVEVSRKSTTGSRSTEALTIHWSAPAAVERVIVEYRQVNQPDHISKHEFAGHRGSWATFALPAADLKAGGPISAWRVTLWDGDQLLAEKKSALW